MPFSRRASLERFLSRRDEQVIQVPLDGSNELLPPERAAKLRRGATLDGTLDTDGTRYFYAARLVSGKGFLLLRPVSSTNSAWRPHIKGLIFAALATATLAALAAFLLSPAASYVSGLNAHVDGAMVTALPVATRIETSAPGADDNVIDFVTVVGS